MEKIISLIIATIYLISAYFGGGFLMVLQAFIFCLFAVMLIWFSDEMGSYTGNIPWITKESPGELIKFLGWLVLFTPVIIFLLIYLF